MEIKFLRRIDNTGNLQARLAPYKNFITIAVLVCICIVYFSTRPSAQSSQFTNKKSVQVYPTPI